MGSVWIEQTPYDNEDECVCCELVEKKWNLNEEGICEDCVSDCNEDLVEELNFGDAA